MTTQNKPAPKLKTTPNWQDKWRPRRLRDVIGQVKACQQIYGMLKKGEIPQTILIEGPSGVAKSTLARIIANHLSPSGHDIFESNAAEDTGIEKMRGTIESAQVKPMHGDFKVYVIDEAHGLTKQAGSAALAFLEKPPSHVVVIMATTEPERMLKTLRDRATKITLNSLSEESIRAILVRVAEGEKIFQPINEHKVLFNTLARLYTGSARPAIDTLYKLSLIHATRPLKKDDLEKEVIELLEFNYKDAALFVSRFYSGDNTAFQILKSIGDPAGFVSLLCSIHFYMLQKMANMTPAYDFLGETAMKGIKKKPTVPQVNENFSRLLKLRENVINPVGRNPLHLLLNGCLELKD